MKYFNKNYINLIPIIIIFLFFTSSQSYALDRGIVFIAVDTGAEHMFSVEIATAPRDVARGLMFRKYLKEKHGMLFDFKTPKIVRMWMKNTLISLDLLFVDRDGYVQGIEENTIPLSESIYTSDIPVRWVLEISAGSVKSFGINIGDQITVKRSS